LLSSGKVLAIGGWNDDDGDLPFADLYDPSTGLWSPAGDLATGRSHVTATVLADDTVLVAGGYSYISEIQYAAAELYSEGTNLWSTTGSLNDARAAHTADLLPDDTVLVAGGLGGSGTSSELYDPRTGTWSATTGAMGTSRVFHVSALLSTGKVLVAGGSTPSTIHASAELYDPTPGTWSAAGSMTSPHSGCGFATTLLSGKVLVVGGQSATWPSPSVTTAADLYDPTTDTWSSTASLNTQRIGHKSNLLAGGSVLVTGGYQWHGPGWVTLLNSTATAEIYTP
jgi:N-acetylneuraminic acid mutarotase